jgi:hypothetical protein
MPAASNMNYPPHRLAYGAMAQQQHAPVLRFRSDNW